MLLNVRISVDVNPNADFVLHKFLEELEDVIERLGRVSVMVLT